jgi:hypothetical protein
LARAASSGGGGISSFSCSSFVKPAAFDTVRLRRVSSVVVVPGATLQIFVALVQAIEHFET